MTSDIATSSDATQAHENAVARRFNGYDAVLVWLDRSCKHFGLAHAGTAIVTFGEFFEGALQYFAYVP